MTQQSQIDIFIARQGDAPLDSPPAVVNTMTLAEQIQAAMLRRETLRAELEDVERQLIEAGAILAVSVVSAGFLRRRGRLVNGDSCRARILATLSDGRDWQCRDIICRIPMKRESVMAQVARMTAEGDIVRVRHGVYRMVVAVVAPVAQLAVTS